MTTSKMEQTTSFWTLATTSDVVLDARPSPRGASTSHFMALASKVEALVLALGVALTVFWIDKKLIIAIIIN